MSGSPYDELLIKYDIALLGTGESFQLKDNMLEVSSQENSAEASYDELRPSPTGQMARFYAREDCWRRRWAHVQGRL